MTVITWHRQLTILVHRGRFMDFPPFENREGWGILK
jgi:hypothetical protein